MKHAGRGFCPGASEQQQGISNKVQAVTHLLLAPCTLLLAIRAGVSALLTSGREQLSLVDCVSFELMRQLGIRTAFTFDRHFEEQGFTCLPG